MSSTQDQPEAAAAPPETTADQDAPRRGRPPKHGAEPYPERKRKSDRLHLAERRRRSRAKRAAEGATTVTLMIPQEARALFLDMAAAVRQDPGIIAALSAIIAPRE